MERHWTWQLENSIATVEQLAGRLPLVEAELRGLEHARRGGLPFRVTPYYLSLVVPDDRDDPIRRQIVPTDQEAEGGEGLLEDPLAEVLHEVAPGLIRRYRDRALLLVTDQCATYCRHCTRRRRVGRGPLRSVGELEPAFAWIADHEEVREVLVSGGDPLVGPDEWIDSILSRLRAVPHVELIRIGTRVLVTLPMRITDELCRLLGAHHPVYVTTHFNHPREVTLEARRACEALADSGLPLANQSVLLRGVNDNVQTLAELSRALLRARVRPYYLMQCDLAAGTAHLQVSLRRGLEIIAALRGAVSGLGVPTYVLDLPGGAGKVALTPSSIVRWQGREVVLAGPRGELVRYRDPEAEDRHRSPLRDP